MPMIDLAAKAKLQLQVLPTSPRTRAGLARWVQLGIGIQVPSVPICDDHHAPLDYLAHTFFERRGDAVVWANRGGGKTFYGAVATLLDLYFKPGIAIRILAGSRDQASHMYDYLLGFFDRSPFCDAVARRTQRTVTLTNGSSVELLAHTETSVRGTRVQKVRCDEVELFDRKVWAAVQMTTRGKRCGNVDVPGRVEVFSTMHRPFGLMHELIERASQSVSEPNWRPFHWCVLDVIQRCPPSRACETCALREPCGGRARQADGFISVDDVLRQQARTSRQTFETEMLCRRPTRSDAVFPRFDPARHVRPIQADRSLLWVGGMDFGIRSPLVLLWAQVRPGPAGDTLEVIDEYIAGDRPLPTHLQQIGSRDWPSLKWVAVDPAGRARNEQTGLSNVDVLRKAGWSIRDRRTSLATGLEAIRRRLTPATNDVEPTLLIHPRCTGLIEALTTYHYDPDRPHDPHPVKDGPDHAVDALRYLIAHLDRNHAIQCNTY